jgi:hypothetical protein
MSFGLLTLPILVHLVRREERVSFAFPSLMFLKRIPVREHRRRSIRHWWLLLLRCLIVALLCIAFAKPFIHWPTEIAGLSSKSRDRIIVLDRSHSMQSGSRWKNAVQVAGDEIDALGSGDRAALVLFDQDTLLTQKLTSHRAALHEALARAETGDGHTDLTGAISRASALLENSSAAIREIVLISDFQRSGVDSTGQARIAPGIQIIPRTVTGGGEANAAVAAVKLARKALGAGDAVELTARIVTGRNVNGGCCPWPPANPAMQYSAWCSRRTKSRGYASISATMDWKRTTVFVCW